MPTFDYIKSARCQKREMLKFNFANAKMASRVGGKYKSLAMNAK